MRSSRERPTRSAAHIERDQTVSAPRGSGEADRGLFYDRMVVDRDWDETADINETRRRLDVVFNRLLGTESLEGRSLLDAGSGGGHFSAAAVERGARVTSLDVGDNLLAQVAKRCESERVKGSILDIPFDDGFFDVALSSEVIEHTTDPRKGLRELARVVRPGGKLLVTTPGRLWQPVVRGATRLGLRPFAGHENFLWPAVAKRVLESSGISIERYFGFNLLPLFSERMSPFHARMDRLGGRLPFLFVNFAVMGTKRRDDR